MSSEAAVLDADAPAVVTANESAWTKPHFGALESLRGIAAVSVVAVHVRGTAFDGSALEPWLNAIGVFGVPVFFVISGFVLWRPHVARQAEDRPPLDAARFARRRLTRIFPAYYLLLIVSALIASAPWTDTNPLRFMTLSQAFDFTTLHASGPSLIGPTWSLSIEIWLYVGLAVVLLALAFRELRVRTEVMILSVLGAAFALSYIFEVPAKLGIDAPISIWLFSGTQFIAGMLIATAHVHRREVVERLTTMVPLLLGAALVTFAFVAVVGWQDHLMGVVPGVALVLIALGVPYSRDDTAAGPGSPPVTRLAHALLRHPFTIWLGTISFGIYLWHLLILFEIRGGSVTSSGVRGVLLTIIALAVTLVVAAASWYLVERPLLRRVR